MDTLQLDYRRLGSNGVIQVSARLGDAILAVDKLDAGRATQRDRFAAALCEGRPGLDRDAIDFQLMQIAVDAMKEPDATDVERQEVNVNLVRPELFHTNTLSGIAVPVRTIVGDKPAGQWKLYLRWHDTGKRECISLSPSVNLPDDRRLWIHPRPSDPSPTMRPGWSAASRKRWLDGAAAPDAADMFRRLCERIAHFVDLPNEAASGTLATLALWIMHTYVYQCWPATPYVAVGGTLSSGKSRLLSVLSRLAFRSLASSSMTAPCLFRSLHEQGGTLLLDEAERLRDRSPEAGELRAMLLSGYKRGSPAMRLEKTGDTFKRVSFDVYGPKALSCIRRLPEALASRCIRISMLRCCADSPKPRRRLDADPASWQRLRDDLHAIALEHGRVWRELAGRSDVCPASLSGRDFELWQPILALAAFVEDAGAVGLLRIMRDHAEQVAGEAKDDAVPDTDESLLRIVTEHVRDLTAASLKPGDVLATARERDGATFERWSAQGVAAVLRRYGLRTHRGSGNAGRTYARVTIGQLRRIAATYGVELPLPDPDPGEASQASQASRTAALSV